LDTVGTAEHAASLLALIISIKPVLWLQLIDKRIMQARMDIETAARRLAELGNPTRLQIVRVLVQVGPEGLPIGELQSRLGVPASTLAFHLRWLVTAELVRQQREGRIVRCTPNYTAIDETLAFVKENCCLGFSVEGPTARPSAVA
jgi:ArsR family transcriptional regulator